MHPLTVTWAPHIHTEWGFRNFQNWLHAGFDNYLMTPNGRVHRLLTRLAVENLFHPFQAFMFGQKSLAPKMALLHDIPSWCTARTKPSTATRSATPTARGATGPIFPPRQVQNLPGRHLGQEPAGRLWRGPAGPVALPAGRPGAIEEKAGRGALPGLLPEVAPAKLLLLCGRARQLRSVARAHAGHLQQVQQHRRPDRRFPLLHDIYQVRHRPGHL
jgi:hypothetical protein